MLDAQGERHLQQLAPVGPLFEIERIARQLLRDRARSLADASRGPVRLRRAQNAEIIHPVVLPETLVFCSNDCFDQQRRHFVIRHRRAVLDEYLPHQPALAVVDQRSRLHPLEASQVVLPGQTGEFRADGKKDECPYRRTEQDGDEGEEN